MLFTSVLVAVSSDPMLPGALGGLWTTVWTVVWQNTLEFIPYR